MKRYKEQQKEGPRKNSKETNPPLDPIILTEGDLNEIEDKVRDTTAELLQ